MKKRNIFISLLFLTLIFLSISYYRFNTLKEELVNKIPHLESIEFQNHIKRKKIWEKVYNDSITYKNKKTFIKFKDNGTNSGGLTDFNDAIIERDTTLRFLFFYKTVSYQGYHEKYFECLCYHKVSRWNSMTTPFIQTLEQQLVMLKQYEVNIKENEFNYLKKIINRIKEKNDKRYFPYKDIKNEKNSFCDEIISTFAGKTIIDEFSLNEFKHFYNKYKSDKENINNTANINRKKNIVLYKKYSKGLNSFLMNVFDVYWKKNSKKMFKKFFYDGNSQGIGKIEYSFEYEPLIMEEDLIKYVNEISFNHYKTNSLSTGSNPYTYCYGRNPYCSPPPRYTECSYIDIKASDNSDVIVIVKKNNRVYSHAYIKAGGYYKFKLGNGNFQTFFYYGNGWNPNKFIKNASCGKITGGFVSDESLDKSDIISLRNSSMSYTLYTVSNGNFQPKSSNKNEAF